MLINGMVVDLKKCVGCNACAVACKSEHNAPTGILLTAVLEKEMGKFPDSNRVFVPVLCNHCQNATCVDVCPSKTKRVKAADATSKTNGPRSRRKSARTGLFCFFARWSGRSLGVGPLRGFFVVFPCAFLFSW